MKMLLRSVFCLFLLTTPVWAKPEGFYHQEYQYKQSSSSFKNNELQHKKDDEGFYTKDGDLTGSQDPKVNEQHEHREFINPKLRTQGYTEQNLASGSAMDLHRRTQQFLRGGGEAFDQFASGSSGAYGSSSKQNAALHSGATLSSGMQSFMTNLQYDMQRQLERQLQQWRQDQEDYASANAYNSQNRLSSTSSGLYSPSTASAESIRRELQEEIRTNLTREIDLRNRVAQTQYDISDINDIKQQLQENLMRQLNVLMQEQQDRVGTRMYPTSAGSTAGNAFNTRQQSASSSSIIKKSASTQTSYAPSVAPTGNQYSSYEQDDLNKHQQYQQQRSYPTASTPVIAPDQYMYTPSSPTASRNYGSTVYGSSTRGSTTYEKPTPIIRNANQITEIAQQVQNDMQKILINALDQYQHEHSFNPANKYQTKPDYQYARQDFQSRLQYNLTDLFQSVLDRNFGPQDLRDQYYFSRGADASQQQRYANYKLDDYERLKQQVTENLQKFLTDSLKSQQEYYETQETASSSSSQSAASYTSGGQYNSPYQEGYYNSRPANYGQGSSGSYSASSSYSGSAAYQTESRPQRTGGSYTKSYQPTGGYRATPDFALYGTFGKYQSRGDQQYTAGQVGASEDCDEGMQGDDPRAYMPHPFQTRSEVDNFGVQQKPSQSSYGLFQTPLSYSEALAKPVTSEEDYQRPVSDLEDYQRPVNEVRYYQQPTSAFQKPYSRFYNSERQFNNARSDPSTKYSFNSVNTPKVGQYSMDAEHYDDDIQSKQKFLHLDNANQSNVDIHIEAAPSINSDGDQYNWNRIVSTPTTEKMKSFNKAQIDEIAQKLKDSVVEIHGNIQQKTLQDDDIEVDGKSSTTAKPVNFNNFYGSTEKTFRSENEDLLRVMKPYGPQTNAIPSSTLKYNDQSSESYNSFAIPKYVYYNRQPMNSMTHPFYVRTSTEMPKIGSHDFRRHHLDDSYEDLQVLNNPLYIKPKIGVHFQQNSRIIPIVQRKLSVEDVDIPKKPKIFPEDDEFLENVLRQPKATNEEDEYDEDLAQKPVDDNQEVVINSHRGDIESFAKPYVLRNPLESNRDLPIRLADISSQQDIIKPMSKSNLIDENNFEDAIDPENQNRGPLRPILKQNDDEEDLDDLQRTIDLIDVQKPSQISPNRNTLYGDGPKPFIIENQYSDDVQRSLEDLDDLQRPLDDYDDMQRPVQLQNYEDYDQQFNQEHYLTTNPDHYQRRAGERHSHFVQNGRRLPDPFQSVTEAAQLEFHEQETKPTYLNSDYNINEEQENFVRHENNSTDTQSNRGFWKSFGGKFSDTYNSAKQKARDFVEKINLL